MYNLGSVGHFFLNYVAFEVEKSGLQRRRNNKAI